MMIHGLFIHDSFSFLEWKMDFREKDETQRMGNSSKGAMRGSKPLKWDSKRRKPALSLPNPADWERYQGHRQK